MSILKQMVIVGIDLSILISSFLSCASPSRNEETEMPKRSRICIFPFFVCNFPPLKHFKVVQAHKENALFYYP